MTGQYDPHYEEDYVEEGPPVLTEAEIQEILAEYHRKQLIENLIGPGLSLLVHMVVLLLMFILIVSKPRGSKEEIVVETKTIEPVEIEKEVIEEITQEEEVTEEVPEVEPTEAPSDSNQQAESLVDVSDDVPMTNDNVDAEEVLDIKVSNSALTFSGPMGGRSDSGRRGLTRRYGGKRRGQIAVNRALKWLARVQNDNGSWGPGMMNGGHPAHTGLALLVFLAHGETPASDLYGKTVEGAIRWLTNYAMDPNLKNKVRKRPMGYSHGIATYALCEAYAMTKIPIMRQPMENAVAALVDGQQASGGFGYGYEATRWDMSVAGWNIQALKSAFVAGSTNEKLPNAIRKAVMFLHRTARCKNGSRTGFGYAEKSGGPAKSIRENLTGAGVVCLQLLGATKLPEVNDAIDTVVSKVRLEKYKEVAQNPAKWREIGGECLYGWYYDTQAVFNAQAHGLFKGTWKEWNETFQKVLIRAQNPEGYWETNGQHGIGKADTPGRILATCLAALQLEVYYRYLPTFDIHKMDAAKLKDAEGIEGAGAVGEVQVQ